MFWKTFHLILIHFYFLYSMLWGMFFKNSVKKKKKGAFPDFWLIHCVFRSIEILVKNFSEPLSGSIDRTCFSINRTLWIKFFFNKNLSFDLFKHLFKTFLKFFFTLSDSARLHRDFFFCRFPPKFLQSFSLPKPVCLFYPSFCIVFLIFMHFLMVFG